MQESGLYLEKASNPEEPVSDVLRQSRSRQFQAVIPVIV